MGCEALQMFDKFSQATNANEEVTSILRSMIEMAYEEGAVAGIKGCIEHTNQIFSRVEAIRGEIQAVHPGAGACA